MESLRLRGQLVRTGVRDGETRLVASVFHLTLAPDGRIAGAPTFECGEDERAEVARILHTMFGARTLVLGSASEGSSERADWLPVGVELAAPVRYRVDEVSGAKARGRFVARIRTVRGAMGRARAHFDTALGDGFSGSTDVALHFEGGVGRAQAIRVLVRPAVPGKVARVECEPFDSQRATATIRESIRAIQQCYEAQLRSAPTMAGRVLVRFRIDVDGHVRAVTHPEDTLHSPGVCACLDDTFSRFRFDPAPAGPVTYAYPFVFAPQN